MDRHQFQDALGKFQTACIMNPTSDTGCLNIGIALLNMKQYETAETILVKSAEREPKNPRVWFNLGLLHRNEGKPDDALTDFHNAASVDPNDAYTQYMIGLVYSEDERDDEAIGAFKNAVRLDRFQASAELALAQAEERRNDTEAALAHLNRFRRLVADNLAHQISSIYGEQGRYSLAEEMKPDPISVGPGIRVRFIDATEIAGLPSRRAFEASGRARRIQGNRKGIRRTNVNSGPAQLSPVEGSRKTVGGFLGSGACVIDYDGDGKADIFLVNADGRGDAGLYRNVGRGKFVNVTKAAKLVFHGEGTGCAIGDYDNDGRADIALSTNGSVMLYRNIGNGVFQDVTELAGIHTDGLSLGLTFVDYNHDGNLDLYIARFNDFALDNSARPFSFPLNASPPGNMLWRNNGNGTFVDATKEMAVEGSAPSIAGLGSDLNNDRAIDIVLTGWQKAPSLLLNERDGAFRATTPWGSAMPGPAAGVTALDFDGDTWMDLAFTHWAPPGLSLWRNNGGISFDRIPLPDTGWMRGWGLAALDYDNDGWVDLVAVGENFSGEGRIILLRNEGDQGFRDVTRETGLDKITLHNPRSLIAFDSDGDGATDLLITQNDLPPVLLRNAGAKKNGWSQLAVQGTWDTKGGAGASIELFAGARRQKWEVAGASGYLGQNSADVLAGLGDESGADVIRVLWPRGLLQNELQIRGGKRNVITEIERPVDPTNP